MKAKLLKRPSLMDLKKSQCSMKLNAFKLVDVASVDVSGVDKKSHKGETQVRLCNYVDVYYNWAITKDMYDGFMKATAKDDEIKEFTVRKGYLAITKDSETRDDIGIPAYFADDFDQTVVLGYHTALIKPNPKKVDPRFLNALLHSDYIKEYWFNNATGSGQRYTLSPESIENAPVFLPELPIQKKIGSYLAAIDRKICLNKAENTLLINQGKELFNYWFAQFDFPNNEGKPYRASGGMMEHNDILKRDIPANWEVKALSSFTSNDLEVINPSESPQTIFKHLSIPEYDKSGFYAEESGKEIKSSKYIVTSRDIIVSKLNPWVSRVIWGFDEDNLICSSEFVALSPEDKALKGFVFFVAKSDPFTEYCTKGSTGTSHSHRRINPDLMRMFEIPFNKEVAKQFSSIVEPYLERITGNLLQNKKLESYRDYILPLLMNGQATIAD